MKAGTARVNLTKYESDKGFEPVQECTGWKFSSHCCLFFALPALPHSSWYGMQYRTGVRAHNGNLAKGNDVIDDEAGFAGDDHAHRDAFRGVVVGAMQEINDSNTSAKT